MPTIRLPTTLPDAPGRAETRSADEPARPSGVGEVPPQEGDRPLEGEVRGRRDVRVARRLREPVPGPRLAVELHLAAGGEAGFLEDGDALVVLVLVRLGERAEDRRPRAREARPPASCRSRRRWPRPPAAARGARAPRPLPSRARWRRPVAAPRSPPARRRVRRGSPRRRSSRRARKRSARHRQSSWRSSHGRGPGPRRRTTARQALGEPADVLVEAPPGVEQEDRRTGAGGWPGRVEGGRLAVDVQPPFSLK